MSASPFAIDPGAFAALVERAPFLLWATVFLFLLTLWMVVEIIVIRSESSISARRDRALEKDWESIFFAAALDDTLPQMPRIARRDRIRVMKIWCHTGDYVTGEARTRLAAAGQRLGLDRIAQRTLAPSVFVFALPSPVEVLLAIRTAERMRLVQAWPQLEQLVRRGPAPLDRAAARALVALDAQRAAPAIVPALVRQGRWARHLVADLVDAGVAGALDTYCALLATVPDEAVPGLALLLDGCASRRAVHAVRARLADSNTRDPEAMAALLNTLAELGDQRDLTLVRRFITHEQWFVRMRAAQALGRCGGRDEAATLEVLLGDPNWYTRYHAARAILRLPELGEAHLRALSKDASDRFARDMARHVLAESATPAVR